MRGFHLYAALLGSLMVAITVAYALYLGSIEHSKVSFLLEMERRARFIPYTDIMREESFSSIAETFRLAFQEFLESTPIFIPGSVLENGDLEEWVRKGIFKQSYAVTTLASYLYAELRSYTAISYPGQEIRLEAGVGQISEVIRNGFYVIPRRDSVVLVYDPRLLPPKVREELPKMKVCESGYCREITVFPTEKTEVTIPLRLLKALQKTRETYNYLQSHKWELTLSAGFCKRDCAACGVFEGDPPERIVYPPEGEKKCQGFSIEMGKFVDESGYYRIMGIHDGGCPNLSLLDEETKKYIPCSDPKTILQRFYAKKLEEISKEIDGNLQFDPRVIREVPTKAFVYEEVFDASFLTASTIIPPEILEAIGIPIYEHRGIVRLPGSPCRFVGEGECAFPAALQFIYSWTDEDNKYSVTGEPVTYHFYINLGPTEINNALAPDVLEVKNIEEMQNTTTTNYGECISRLQNTCQVQNLISLLKPVCPNIQGNDINQLWLSVQNSESNACKLSAELLIGENGACRNIEKACEKGISVSGREEVKNCAVKRLEDCWKYLAELYDGDCSNYVPPGSKALCTLSEASSYLPSTFVLQKMMGKAADYFTSYELSDITRRAYMDLSPDILCKTETIFKLYEEGKLEGDCLKEVNELLSSETSPCVNPVASCLITSFFKPVQTSSPLCNLSSPVKLRSTFHFNIFDPTYLAVGCYAGND